MRWRIPKYFPGWFVSGGGGSGGSGTVQTDGVTLQGDGSGGNKIRILAVQTDATLSGAGTVASKLSVVSTPLTVYSIPCTAGAFLTAPANQLILIGWYLEVAVTFSNLGFNIGTADNTNNSDFGFYNAAGTLVAHIGAQHLGSTGFQSAAIVGGPVTAQPGLIFQALTSAAGTLQINADTQQLVLYRNLGFGTSVGGALPATITPPTLAASNALMQMSMF